jgi:hypothetical protein
MVILILLGIGIIAGIIKVFITIVNDTIPKQDTYIPEEEKPDINEIERLERYSQQIDGYTQLIKLLDTAYKKETDTKRKAALLSKQLSIIDKLDKTIAKLEKLDS